MRWQSLRDDFDLGHDERGAEGRPDDALPDVAVVGAGMAGSTCAALLRDYGLPVRALDKGRGPGGRMATRRTDVEGLGEVRFDHGAQYFTARDDRFRGHVDAWRDHNVVERWDPSVVVLKEGEMRTKEGGPERFVGTPTMSAVVGHLADAARPEFGVRVDEIARRDEKWRLTSAEGTDLGDYDALVVTAPAEQTVELLEAVETPVFQTIKQVSMQPTWSVMLAFDGSTPVEFDGAFVHESPLGWVARNGTKPGRDDVECWVLHSTHDWAAEHIDRRGEDVAESLVEALREQLQPGVDWPSIAYRRAHRWRYAEAVPPLEQGALWDADRSLVVAGDWVNGSRVEGAFLSGWTAAGTILQAVGRR